MAAIKSNFENLKDPNGQAVGVYADIAKLKRPLPAVAVDKVSLNALTVHLQQLAGDLLKEEIQADPLAIGYAGKTDAQIADLLNTSIDPNTYGSRLNTIWRGLPYAPNQITAADVNAALN